MAVAWADPAAWEGESQAGGVTMPAAVHGLFGLNEVVVHGWDLARATGQAYSPDPAAVAACTGLITSIPDLPRDGTLFGPAVDPVAGASPMDRLAALTGRDPGWAPAG